MKNQEGQTPLDLATADDVRALLADAMPTIPQTPVASKSANVSVLSHIPMLSMTASPSGYLIDSLLAAFVY
jgi:hypothetical protein